MTWKVCCKAIERVRGSAHPTRRKSPAAPIHKVMK